MGIIAEEWASGTSSRARAIRFGNLLGDPDQDWENDMATFITQARFTKDGLNNMIAAPQDRAEVVGRLIAQVGGGNLSPAT
jgi:hypothetical protein